MKVTAIIQARTGSTRLPGKVLKKVLGKPLLEYQVERVKRAKTVEAVVVATTENERDDPIVRLCRELSVPVYRGPEEDVLARYYEAAVRFHADPVVRLTADCPIIDPAVIDRVVACYVRNQGKYDYVSNTLERTYPRGMDTEVVSFRALKRAFEEAKDPASREHVTAYIYRHPDRFRLGNVSHPADESRHRWTVDTGEDFLLIQKIIERLYPENPLFTMDDVLRVLRENPEWAEINAHVEQKKL